MQTDHVTRLLGLGAMVVDGFANETETDVFLAVSTARGTPLCRTCGQPCLLVHSTRPRTVRHLDVFGRRSWLCFDSRMVDCITCGLGAEALPFVEPGKRTSIAFSRYVGGLCAILPNKDVAELVHVSEDAVRSIDKEYLAMNYPPADLAKLRIIAIDEIAYRKGHKYLTVILNYETGEVIWTGEGRREATVQAFFSEVGPDVTARIAFVSMDMAAPFIKAVQSACPNATIVFDRFHVAKHVNEALNDVRKKAMADADKKTRRAVKGKRFVLLRRGESLTAKQQERLDQLLDVNLELTRAYLTGTSAIRHQTPSGLGPDAVTVTSSNSSN